MARCRGASVGGAPARLGLLGSLAAVVLVASLSAQRAAAQAVSFSAGEAAADGTLDVFYESSQGGVAGFQVRHGQLTWRTLIKMAQSSDAPHACATSSSSPSPLWGAVRRRQRRDWSPPRACGRLRRRRRGGGLPRGGLSQAWAGVGHQHRAGSAAGDRAGRAAAPDDHQPRVSTGAGRWRGRVPARRAGHQRGCADGGSGGNCMRRRGRRGATQHSHRARATARAQPRTVAAGGCRGNAQPRVRSYRLDGDRLVYQPRGDAGRAVRAARCRRRRGRTAGQRLGRRGRFCPDGRAGWRQRQRVHHLARRRRAKRRLDADRAHHHRPCCRQCGSNGRVRRPRRS